MDTPSLCQKIIMANMVFGSASFPILGLLVLAKKEDNARGMPTSLEMSHVLNVYPHGVGGSITMDGGSFQMRIV